MAQNKFPEVWLRGPVANIPALLQPIAQALLQAREEVNEILVNFPENHLWDSPAGAASAGFHLQHLKGVLDRLFTYAKNKPLNNEQLYYLSIEGDGGKCNCNLEELVQLFNDQVDKTMEQLSAINMQTLYEPRGVGRAQLPSTVLGLLFHSAEHTMRHVGQLLVTVKVIKGGLYTS